MKNHIIRLDKDQGKELAEKNFRDMCGYNRGKPVPQKRIERSLRSLEDVYHQLEIKALISEYEKTCADGINMLLDGKLFTCNALAQIPTEEIEGIYIYLLTVGELNVSEASILNQVYYDMWQNAYMDAGQEILRQYLQGLSCNTGRYVSNNFGPGLYGMDISQLEQFFAILDGEKICLKLLDSGFMSPTKSYAGFFLVTNSKQNFLGNTCENCSSSGKACIYCQAKYNIQ
ncbi:vitamin B12 dependent methionine synthase [Desulfosporosinus orientis DSM 765]|uniref:Vitamin B12 dependent methionine synthase n=1 Tax=Desulfosporosinus orientis (strain ATCC 19365 / DSM 765 / NCIMB 8382 / VKM B-1628 / Singapore I) TaxID=768706 RepID=G7WES7_DESOD|nr:vitamin B12 dependent methionine synthase [Desulfosporosinus orientis]AET67256.1 vitamin B12 dependent methionine synthase [Desulfosporosinus orientis DSM 765]